MSADHLAQQLRYLLADTSSDLSDNEQLVHENAAMMEDTDEEGSAACIVYILFSCGMICAC